MVPKWYRNHLLTVHKFYFTKYVITLNLVIATRIVQTFCEVEADNAEELVRQIGQVD
jgi:hypothetical protein